MGLAAGAAITIALGALPIITVVPALLVGAGIGSGVALGIRQARGK